MMRRIYNTAIRTALIYLIFGVLWTLLSDRVVEVSLPASAHVMAQNIKGTLFVAASALLIYAVTHSEVKALEESQSRLNGVLEAAPDAMIIVRQNRKIEMVNQQVENIFGYSEDELLGQNVELLMPERFRAAHRKHQMDFFSSPHRRADSMLDLVALRKDGSEFTAEINLDFQTFGQEHLAIASVRDITERKQAEQKLLESESKYRALFEQNTDAIFILDLQGSHVDVNQRAADMLGYTREELIGKSFRDISAEIVEIENTLRRLLNGESIALVERTFRKKNGDSLPVEINVELVRDVHNDPIHILSMVRDITERKQAEEKLRESEKRYRLLFENNPHPMWVYDLETLAFLMVNDAALDHYGYTREEFLGMTLKDIRPAEEIPNLLENIARETGVLQKSDGWKHRLKNGSLIDVEITSHALEFEGRSARLVTANDITERKQAEEEQFRLMRVLELSLNEIFLFDDKTLRFQYVNQGARDNLGYSLDELRRLTPVDLKPEFTAETFMNMIAPLALREKEVLVFETIHRRKDGSTYPVEVHLQRVKTGESSLFVAIIHNTTERKKMEQSLRESEARFRSLVEQMPAIIYVAALDEKSTTLYVSPQINQYIDPSEKRQAGSDIWIDFLHPLDRKRVLEELRRSREGNKPFTCEYRIIASNGEVVWFRDTASLVCDENGAPLFNQGMMLDITERRQAEEQIETLARFPAENPSPVMRSDLSGRLLYANHASAPLLDLWNCRVGELLPLDWHEKVVSVYASGSEDKLDVQCGERIFSTRITPIVGKGYVNIYATDVTERRQAEKSLIAKHAELQEAVLRLEQSRNMLSLIIESAPVRVFWKDTGSRYLGCNRLFARDAGLETVEQVIGKVDDDLYWKDMAENFRRQEREVIETGQPIMNQVETQAVPGGGLMWINTSIVPLQNPGGKALGVLGIYEDITERKRAEDDLMRYTARLEEAETHANLGSWEFDVTSGQGWWSKQMYRLFGFDVSDSVPEFEPYLERIHPEDRQIVLNVLQRMARGEEPAPREYRTNPEFGLMRYLSPTVYAERNAHGAAIRFIGTLLDITERKQAEEKVQVQLRRIVALNEIDRAISASLDMHLSLEVLLYEVTSQLGVDAASVLFLNPIDQSLEFVAGKGFRTNAIRETHLQIGQGLPGFAGLERRVLHIANLHATDIPLIRVGLFKSEEFIEYFGVPLIAKGLLKGVLEIFNRSPLTPDSDWMHYLETLGGQAAIAIDNAQLFEDLQESHQELVTAYDATIRGWSRAMDLRDKETEGHTMRVTEMAEKLARRMGVSQQELLHIRRGALLHDIGKLGVPDHILLKPGKLTDEEWVLMRQHPVYALDMLRPIQYLQAALDIPYCHHEKWDGTGYPRGLKGEQIPLAARIFAVVDVWDALRSDRPYREGWSAQKTRDYIQAESGRHFDPQVASAFLTMLEESQDLN